MPRSRLDFLHYVRCSCYFKLLPCILHGPVLLKQCSPLTITPSLCFFQDGLLLRDEHRPAIMTSGLDLAEVSKSHAPQLTDVPAAPGLINEKNEKRLTIADDSSQTLSFAEPDGTEYPTADEVATLRRVCGTIPWSAYTIGFVELCERFSYYGTTQVCKSIAIASGLTTDSPLGLKRSDSCKLHSTPIATRFNDWFLRHPWTIWRVGSGTASFDWPDYLQFHVGIFHALSRSLHGRPVLGPLQDHPDIHLHRHCRPHHPHYLHTSISHCPSRRRCRLLCHRHNRLWYWQWGVQTQRIPTDRRAI